MEPVSWDEMGRESFGWTGEHEGPTDPFALFPELLGDDMCTMKNVKASIHVKPDATPVFCKARTVPYFMKKKVDEELDRLLSANIIEPVAYCQRAAHIVPILKSDGTVRICVGYKVTVNRYAHIEQYPPPTPEDLFATLADGVKLSKLDMAHAYQQILIDYDRKQYLTINTHRALSNVWSLISPCNIPARDRESSGKHPSHSCVLG